MKIKPFLKWAGGKHKLAPFIQMQLPKAKRLVEPFVGSAAVSLALDFDAYLLNDSNPDLIGLYEVIKKHQYEFLVYAQSFFVPENNTEARFYELREQFNASIDIVERAAIFVYLNRHAFNGLCRYNGKGFFNVPFGRYKSPSFPLDAMKNFIQKSHRMTFICGDFETVFHEIQSDDAVYCDPPYVPLNETSSFTAYAQGGFSWQDQVRLFNCVEQVAKKCRGVVLSNHDTPQTRDLYRNASHIQDIKVQRNIAAQVGSRQKVGELLIRWHDIDFNLQSVEGFRND